MENLQQNTLICAYKKQAYQTCINPKCKEVCFVCDHKCQCKALHKECDKVDWDYITKKLNRDLNKNTEKFKSFSDTLDQLYQNTIKHVTKVYDDFKAWRDDFGLTELQSSFLHLIEQGRFTEMTSAKMYEIRKEIRKPSKVNLKSEKQLKDQAQSINTYTEKLVQQLEGLYKQNKVIKEQLVEQQQDKNKYKRKMVQHTQTKVNLAHKLLGLNENGSRFFTMINQGVIEKQLMKILQKINLNEQSINENKKAIHENKQTMEQRIKKLTETVAENTQSSNKVNTSKQKTMKKQINTHLRIEEMIYKIQVNNSRFQIISDLRQQRVLFAQIKALFAQTKINGLSTQLQSYCDKISNQISTQILSYYQKTSLQIDLKFKKFIKDHSEQKLSTEELNQALVKLEQQAQINAKQIQLKINKIKQQTMFNMFNKKIKKWNLLYRASQNNFQTSKCWDQCNGKTNTLTILKTQFGKIIGGYTPLAWNKSINTSQQDPSKQTFLFSITEKHKIPISQNEEKALQHYANHSYGPTFGGGHDLYICDKANITANNYGNIGHTYNNGEYTYGNQQSYKKWTGQSNGSNFLIQQWEVYEIVFQ